MVSYKFSNLESAYQFDGINDYIELPLSILEGEEGTIVCWIQLADTISRNAIFGAGAPTTTPSTFGIYFWPKSDGQNQLFHSADRRLCGGIQKYFCDTITFPKLGSWHLVALKSDGIETEMYMDGVLLNNLFNYPIGGSRGEWFSDICSPTYASIGRRIRKIDEYYFNGIIDEFRIYDRPLDDQEIMALYNDGVCQVTVYDTIFTEVFDTTFITIQDTLTTEVFDTTYITIQDTITIEVFDTTFITVIDTITVTDTLIIDVVLTGINPPDNINTIKVYPNPANDHIFINTGDYTKMNGYQLKIIDQLGAIVFDTYVEEPLYEVDLSNWTGLGMYYIQVIDLAGSIIESRKIILQ